MIKKSHRGFFYDYYRAWNIKLNFMPYWYKVMVSQFKSNLFMQKGGANGQERKATGSRQKVKR